MPHKHAKKLERIRTGIDRTDNGIVRLLSERRSLVIALAKIKKDLDIPIYDRKREQALIDRVKKQTVTLDPEKCTRCGLCLSVGCPAIIQGPDRSIRIAGDQCSGCYVCVSYCRFNALTRPGTLPS